MLKNTPANRLIHETSLYLLQHAHNPVHWYAWGDEALSKAAAQDRLMLISIGYSSCHWCHVMEKECFEDETAAQLMNELFVCIKVDREERPDLDNLYMGALQLMTGRGGWPLNIIALPDGRPVWGATYLPKDKWQHALRTVHDLYANDPKRVLEYAESLEQGIRSSDEIVPNRNHPEFSSEELQDMTESWKRRFDGINGGPNKAPKFPLPSNYHYLLNYSLLSLDESVNQHVLLTLNKMAMGGIYDQAGGGFARYSVDGIWKVPHFEKMLYDNAQLISLYSEAYRATKDSEYARIAEQTISFLNREMRGEEHQYFSAIDADSEGVEGMYYIWTVNELKSIIPAEEWKLFSDYYSVHEKGYWEKDYYILIRTSTDQEFCSRHGLLLNNLQKQVKHWNQLLLNTRKRRIKPGVDQKALTALNAMMIKALADAGRAFGKEEYLTMARKTAGFIKEKLLQDNHMLWHTYSPGEAKIGGFLDDYAQVISAWIALYSLTGEEEWLLEAIQLTRTVVRDFDAGENGLFYYTALKDKWLSRTTEVTDNVIPSSNSVMAHNLEVLGMLTNQQSWRMRARKMAMQVKNDIFRYGEGYSNWASLMLSWVYPFYEVVICGPAAKDFSLEIHKNYYPNMICVWSENPSNLELFKGRYKENETLIYVCRDGACNLPVNNIPDAWNQIRP